MCRSVTTGSGASMVSGACRWQGSLEVGRKVTQKSTGSQSLCSWNQGVGVLREKGSTLSDKVWGPQSPGSVSRRLLAPLCRADAGGKWPWLRLSASVNRTEAEDCKGPGERGRRVGGRSLSSWGQSKTLWGWLSYAAPEVSVWTACLDASRLFLAP